MRYSAEHKEQTRRRIVEAAGATAKKQGFGSTGVDGLMGAAGLKGSTFYHHFGTKNDLLRQIITSELASTRKLYAGKRTGAKSDLLKQALAYLSVHHAETPEEGCVLPALSAEIARSDMAVKKAYEESLKLIHNDIEDVIGDAGTSWALLALSVGAITIARAMASEETRDEVLKACSGFTKRTFEALESEPS